MARTAFPKASILLPSACMPAHCLCHQDKTVPKDWFKADNLTMFPPEKDLQVGVLWWEGES